MNKVLAGLAAILLFHSVAVAAPHIFKSKPEPVVRAGTLLRERMVAKFGQLMRAPGSYPASVKIIFLRVQFQKDLAPSISGTTGSGQWSDPLYAYGNDPDYWINNAKTHFIDYWKEVSYDKLIISVVTSTNVYTLPHPMSYYGDESGAALENLIYDSITVAKADTDPATNVDFTLYDAILIVHAGVGEETDVLWDTPNDIWSLFYSNSSIAPNAGPDASCSNCLSVTGANGTKRITEAIIMPQSDSQDGVIIDPLGVYVHEFGHWLGLPDLYCTAGRFCIPDGVGKWSLMGDGIYNADPKLCPASDNQCWYGSSPAHLDAWSKVFLGWVTPLTAAPPVDMGSHDFAPVENSQDIVKVQASSSTPSQYFLLENRQMTGYDKGLPGHGLLIWLIDDYVINLNFFSNTINNSMYRPGVKVIEADNDWKLQFYGCASPDDCGNAGDPFPGSTNNTSFTLHSAPPSTAYSPAAWVNVRNIVETAPANTITADIGFPPLPPGTPGMFQDTISWPSSTDQSVTGYNVYRNGFRIGQSSSPSFSDSGAHNFDAYQITAVDAVGDESDFSGTVVANMAVGDGGGGDRRCFIATAAYGASWEPHVLALREFRDRHLMTNEAGRAFVRFYYRYSPPLADLIGRHDSLRILARSALTPVVYGIMYPGAFMVLLLAAGMVMAGRRMRVK